MGIVQYENKVWKAPNELDVAFITGDGIGIDVTPVALKIMNTAIDKAYGGSRSIRWEKLFVGEVAAAQGIENLSQEALDKIKKLKLVLKGPLTTPVGSGFRSLNVAIRQKLDLYACVRPIEWFKGVPAPVIHPEKLNVVIFRENTEDVYSGIEWKQGSSEVQDLITFLKSKGKIVREDSGIGIKPISQTGSKRLVRAAIDYAIRHRRKSVTLVHKGNIMKFTEGAFKEWGYEVACEEFAHYVVMEGEANPENKIIIKQRIADAMFQQLLLRPEEYDVIATTNLNGDYLSDACAAQVGGLGLAPGGNVNYESGIAVFEATHGTAPKHAGKNKANPGSILLSGVLLLQTINWREAADLIVQGITKTIQQKRVTYDLERQMQGATLLSCSEFGDAIIENM